MLAHQALLWILSTKFAIAVHLPNIITVLLLPVQAVHLVLPLALLEMDNFKLVELPEANHSIPSTKFVMPLA